MRMNMSMRIATLAVAAFAALSALAAEVSPDMAQRAMRNWRARNGVFGLQLGRDVRDVRRVSGQGVQFHVVRFAGNGVAIVPADTKIRPVIMISDGVDFDENAENPAWDILKANLGAPTGTVRKVALKAAAPKAAPALTANERAWAELLEEDSLEYSSADTIDDVRVGPLVQARWNQGTVGGKPCYNYYTPSNYVCGCVATALAQVMRTFEYPDSTTSVAPYVGKYCKVDGVTTTLTTQGGCYDWADMPYSPSSSMTEAQRKAIGKLTSDLGICLAMSYTADGSGSNTFMAKWVLENCYGYKSAMAVRGLSSHAVDDDFQRILVSNFDAKLPVQIGLSGHSIVGDGYGYDKTGGIWYHLNFGWGSSSAVWYRPPTADDPARGYSAFAGGVYNIYTERDGKYVIASGRVTDESGLPAAGCTVTAAKVSDPDRAVTSATADARGIYALFVEPGEYVVSTYFVRTDGIGARFGSTVANALKCVSLIPVESGNRKYYTSPTPVLGNAAFCDIVAMPVGAMATWTGAKSDSLADAANWAYTNAQGVAESIVPNADTTVLFRGSRVPSVPAGAAFSAKAVVANVTLSSDCDWSGLKAPVTGKIDLRGRNLAVSQLDGVCEITDSSEDGQGGELYVVVTGGAVANENVTLSGSLRLVKEGAGGLMAAKAGQTYSGGTEIAGGAVSTPCGSTATATSQYLGSQGTEIAVARGAELDISGNSDYCVYHLVLAGGTLRNTNNGEAANQVADKTGIGWLTLTADSTFVLSGDTSFSGKDDTPVDLGGHTLTVDGTTCDGKCFWEKDVVNGTIDLAGAAGVRTVFQVSGEVRAEDVCLVNGTGLVMDDAMSVRDYEDTLGWDNGLCAGSAPLSVSGTFKPVGRYFYGCTLRNGATLDLSAQAAAWDTTSASTGYGSKTVTFPDYGTVTINVGARPMEYDAKVVGWTAATRPATVEDLRFRIVGTGDGFLTDENARVRDDGIYYSAVRSRIDAVTNVAGTDFTNGAVRVTMTDVEGTSVRLKVLDDAAGRTVETAKAAASVGTVEWNLAEVLGRELTPGHVYPYEVELLVGDDRVAVRAGEFAAANWNVNFGAKVEGGKDVVTGGAWKVKPEIREGGYCIEDDTSFGVTAETAGSVTRTDVAVTFDWLQDVKWLKDDLGGALGAFSAVRDVNGVPRWMALTSGGWAAVTGAVLPEADVPYVIRIEADFLSAQKRVRYLVSSDGGANFAPLSTGGEAWMPFAAEKSALSEVGFLGGGMLRKLESCIADRSLAEAGGVRYATVEEAVAAAGGGVVTLLTNAIFAPPGSGRWLFAKGGFEVIVDLGRQGDAVCRWQDGALTVASIDKVANITGMDFTNGTVRVTMADVAGTSVRLKVVDNATGRTVTTAAKTASDGAASWDLADVLGGALTPGLVYSYEVELLIGDETVAVRTGEFTAANWNVNFGAKVEGGESVVTGGAWKAKPEIREGAYCIDDDTSFGVTAETAGSVTRTDLAVTFDWLQDVKWLKDDLGGALGAFSAVRDEDGAAQWMAFTPAGWVALTGAVTPEADVPYVIRIEADFLSVQKRVRYFVSSDGGASFAPLSTGGEAWMPFAAEKSALSEVGFAGGGRLKKMESRFADKSLAEVGGVRYATVEEAVAAAGGNAITLLTNATFAPTRSGRWLFVKGGFDMIVDLAGRKDATCRWQDGFLTVVMPGLTLMVF